MRSALALVVSCVGAVLTVSVGLAQPQIPATFYGSVTVSGEPAEAGVEVRGMVNGMDCTQSAPGERPVIRDGEAAAYVLYVVHESQRPGCAREGSLVTFTIDGSPAAQSATWKPGPLRLDLSTGSAAPIPLPSATATSASAVVTATASPDASATLARPTGTPPTDDVRLDGTQIPGSSPSPGAIEGNSGGGSNGTVLVLAALGVLAIAGGALGVFLLRRPRNSADA